MTNLNQIPNLKIGYWQCDAEGDTTVDGYIKVSVLKKSGARVELVRLVVTNVEKE